MKVIVAFGLPLCAASRFLGFLHGRGGDARAPVLRPVPRPNEARPCLNSSERTRTVKRSLPVAPDRRPGHGPDVAKDLTTFLCRAITVLN
jgi:hypothetical protein